MKRLISYCLFFFFVTSLMAQSWCTSAGPINLQAVSKTITRTKTEVTIPVIIHLVWRTEEQRQRLSEAQVDDQLAVLNQDFRALNADLSDVTAIIYQNVIADTEINFVRADTDPNGNPHPGIIFQQTTTDNIGSQFDGDRRHLCYDELDGSSAWPNDCYLNIWVSELGNGIAGIGVFPDEVGIEVPAAEDGVYISWDRFGTLNQEVPYHLGRTLTHEIGHYLNVLHPWGIQVPPDNCNPAICCNDPSYDDLVADTKKQIQTFLDQCPSGGGFGCDNMPPNSQNFMSFADDACLLMFTEGQKERMWETLMGPRNNLLACITNAITTIESADKWLDYAYWQNDQLNIAPLVAGAHWQLFDSQGRLIKDMGWLPDGTQSIKFPALPSGLYLLASAKNGQRGLQKLLKVR